ncbi:hypothetical protein [Sphingopyxis sp. LK2115]|uniref:hypothetical protein n=1 Tax=Sphingopyxis sp. LK2115 TaxID=2744558 RepID=UPI00166024A7|nr:hypothetical protein [Sphingopyxis sp. LK2115]
MTTLASLRARGSVTRTIQLQDDTNGFTPQVQVWTKSRQHWVGLGDLPGFETNPG